MFQSSPNPQTGCDIRVVEEMRAATSFNPHPILRLGATLGAQHPYVLTEYVSILTQSSD